MTFHSTGRATCEGKAAAVKALVAFKAAPEPVAAFKYDAKTGVASANAPKEYKKSEYNCIFEKKSSNGTFEKKDVKVTFLPMASKCMINSTIVSNAMKAGTEGAINIATTIPGSALKATVVEDLAK